MRSCLGHGWTFCIAFLDTDMPALWQDAQALLALAPDQRASMKLPKKQGSRDVRWVNHLAYEGMSLGVIFQTDRDDQGPVIAQFAHLTARPIDRDNVRSRKLATPLDSCFLPVDLPMPGQIRLSTA
jgi:hypothetical protein